MKHLQAWLMLAALAVVAAGCTWSSNDKHIPPEGMGSIIVLNNSGTSFNLTINGVITAEATSPDANPTYDLRPATYIVTLEQIGGVRHWTGGVNVQLGRLTYMDVASDPVNPALYDVVSYVE